MHSKFPGTSIILKSNNGWQGPMSTRAAQLAIAMVAVNWVSWQAEAGGLNEVGKEASDWYYRLYNGVFGAKTTLSKKDVMSILRYAD